MSKSELLKELRALTQAGMKDCADALRETGDDLQKAVDLIKTKGQNIVSGREGKIAAEGLVAATEIGNGQIVAMVEVNCQTDFVARGDDFKKFVDEAVDHLSAQVVVEQGHLFDQSIKSGPVAKLRSEIMQKTKENCVVRRWWVEQVDSSLAKPFVYIHNGSKLGVILTLLASSEQVRNSTEFNQLGVDLAMQVAAMNPLAVSKDKINEEVMLRQKSIFEAQLKELNKPQAQWEKIIAGKFNKWYTDICLLEQESVLSSKKSVKQVIADVGTKLGGTIEVVSFIRCQVGEGIEVEKSDYADEVSQLSGVILQ